LRMTRANNRKFLRKGFYLLNISGFFLTIGLLSKSYGWLPEGSYIAPVIVLIVGITGISGFVFFVWLGIFPHLFKFQYNSFASEKQKKALEVLDFLTLED